MQPSPHTLLNNYRRSVDIEPMVYDKMIWEQDYSALQAEQ